MKMHGDDIIKDPLAKVSGELRKAVGLNRHEIGGLRDAMSQIKRERNKSVGLLSKQQQDFLQKQARLLPSLNAKRHSRRNSNQVIPLHNPLTVDPGILPIESKRVRVQKETLFREVSSSSHFNVLPPISRTTRNFSESAAYETKVNKQRRISEYQKEFSSLQESISNANRFSIKNRKNALFMSSNEFNSAKRETREADDVFQYPSNHKRPLQSLGEEDETENNEDYGFLPMDLGRLSNNNAKRLDHTIKNNTHTNDTNSGLDNDTRMRPQRRTTQTRISSIDEVARANNPPIEESESGDSDETSEDEVKKNYWAIVRKNLKHVAAINKQKHNQYLEKLYEEIKHCRYIRKPIKKRTESGTEYESEDETDN